MTRARETGLRASPSKNQKIPLKKPIMRNPQVPPPAGDLSRVKALVRKRALKVRKKVTAFLFPSSPINRNPLF